MTLSPGERRRLLRDFILFILLFFIVWTVRATILYPIDDTIKAISPIWREVYALVVRLLLWIAPVFIFLIAIDKVDAPRYLRLNTPIDRQSLLPTSALIAAFCGLIILSQYAQAGTQRHVSIDLQSWTWHAILLGLPMAPISEEILFRGFVLHKCQESTGFWQANLITGLLFVAIHWPYWLYSQGLSMDRITLSASILTVGLFAGFLVQKTNSLWPGIVMHLLNNLIAGALVIR